MEVLIDTADLDLVSSFPNSWSATKLKKDREKYQIKGTYRDNGRKVQITLARFILQQKNSEPIRFINKNELDHRRENLTVGYEEVQILKGNEYEIHGDVALIKLKRRNGDYLVTKIDTEDLERVLSHGTWFAEFHKDFNNYMVVCVSYFYINGKKHKQKRTIHSIVKGVDPKEIIRHVNYDTLDNRKSNLRVYSKEMLNDYEFIDEDIVAIHLKDKSGALIAKTLIDSEDLERLLDNGYTWNYFISNREPYVVGKKDGKRIYLHRFIMNAPDDKVVDHIYGDTLDNRKSELRLISSEQNAQNLKGARKGSKSGIRGVSWDNTNQDWIICVKGIYFGRTKDLEEARKIAAEKIDELMPFNTSKNNS